MKLKTLTLTAGLAVSSLAHADTFYTDRGAWQTAAVSNGPLLSGFSGIGTESYFYLGDCGDGRLANNVWTGHFNDNPTLQFDAFHFGKPMSAFGADFTLQAANGSLGLYFWDPNNPTSPASYERVTQSGFIGVTGTFTEMGIIPESFTGLGLQGFGLGYGISDVSRQDPTVPEPATWATMLTGFALLLIGVWRKHAQVLTRGVS